jgi:hypothetical protein
MFCPNMLDLMFTVCALAERLKTNNAELSATQIFLGTTEHTLFIVLNKAVDFFFMD